MGAYFAGVVQSPLTAAVLLVEMTGAHAMALPLLVTTMVAQKMSQKVCPKGLYEALMSLRVLVELRWHADGIARI